MAAKVMFGNYARTTTAYLAYDATTMTVADGSKFPTVVLGESYFYASIVHLQNGHTEIVKVTSQSGNVWTIERAQDGTTQEPSGYSSGSRVELWMTAGALDDMREQLQAAGVVGNSQLADNAVSTSKLQDAAVTAAKLASTLDLSAKTITMPSNRAPKIMADTTGAPDYVGQIGLIGSGATFDAWVGYATSSGAWLRVPKVLASVAAAPSFVGQVSIAGGLPYIALGTSTASDWHLISADYGVFAVQVSDITPPDANHVSLYTKSVSGTLQLFMKRASGDPLNLSDPSYALGAMQPANLPTWDSGWTRINPSKTYDLTMNTRDDAVTPSGGFSMTTGKASSSTNETNASAEFATVLAGYTPDSDPFRAATVEVKRTKNGATSYNDVMIFGLNSVCGTYDYTDGWSFVWKGSSGTPKLWLNTGVQLIHTRPTMGIDWNTSNWASDLLMRIKIWK